MVSFMPAIMRLFHSRAAFKARIAKHGIPDVTCLPYRVPLVSLLRQEKARGRPINLVTAADQTIADAVAAKHCFARRFGYREVCHL
jgi:hypothetical protein